MKLLSLLLLILSSSILQSQHINNISFGSYESLDVITWNIERFPKAGQNTMDSVGQIIKYLNADIIALQEIDDTTKFKEVISKLDGYETYFKSSFYAGLGYVFNSNTITIQKAYEIYVTSQYWRAFPRSPLVLEIAHNEEDYIIINNHFKCCGDEHLDINDPDDQETRRLEASILLKTYVDENFHDQKVIVLGDLNDLIIDDPSNNVFQAFIDDSDNYLFADMDIANSNSDFWSYPWWPSHLDHILITDELFELDVNPVPSTATILLDNYFVNGFFEYDAFISDHRPVGMKIQNETTSDLNYTVKSQESLKIHPNPARNFIKLEIINETKDLIIYNSFGQIVKRIDIPPHPNFISVDLLSFSPGIYFICAFSNSWTTQCRSFVKD